MGSSERCQVISVQYWYLDVLRPRDPITHLTFWEWLVIEPKYYAFRDREFVSAPPRLILVWRSDPARIVVRVGWWEFLIRFSGSIGNDCMSTLVKHIAYHIHPWSLSARHWKNGDLSWKTIRLAIVLFCHFSGAKAMSFRLWDPVIFRQTSTSSETCGKWRSHLSIKNQTGPYQRTPKK